MSERDPFEFEIVREVFGAPKDGKEGYTLGRFYFEHDKVCICHTLEDQDRHLEDGNGKVYGTTAMPTGRFELELYNSPKHGTVPLFKNVPGFSYTEIHKANHAEQLLGCVAVGENVLVDGVSNCEPALMNIVSKMREARAQGVKVFCTIRRAD